LIVGQYLAAIDAKPARKMNTATMTFEDRN
jgi:hypothetical protein